MNCLLGSMETNGPTFCDVQFSILKAVIPSYRHRHRKEKCHALVFSILFMESLCKNYLFLWKYFLEYFRGLPFSLSEKIMFFPESLGYKN